jgi:hypothetical protein
VTLPALHSDFPKWTSLRRAQRAPHGTGPPASILLLGWFKRERSQRMNKIPGFCSLSVTLLQFYDTMWASDQLGQLHSRKGNRQPLSNHPHRVNSAASPKSAVSFCSFHLKLHSLMANWQPRQTPQHVYAKNPLITSPKMLVFSGFPEQI